MRGSFILTLVTCGALAGCSGDQSDIEQWMNHESASMHGAVKPLPEIRIFPVVDFNTVDTADPFDITRIEPVKPEKASRNDPRLNPDRQREPLEYYPLEALKMVGILEQGKKGIHALIQADKVLYQVHVGNFMGLSYGKVVSITADSLELQELVDDLNEGWIERTTTMQLQEQQEAGK